VTRRLKIVLSVGIILAFGGRGSAQGTGSSPTNDCQTVLQGLIPDIRDGLTSSADRSSAMRAIESWPAFLCGTVSDSIRSQLLSEAEEKRLDKQAGATSNSSGTTSLVSKGSSPSLFGFALEHGGLTQTTDGNTITFRGNAANSVRALLNNSYLGSYQLGQDDPLVVGLAKLSFGVSFDTSSNQSSTSQGFAPSSKSLSGFSSKYELYDRRDPRDRHYLDRWQKLSNTAGRAFANSIRDFDTVIRGTPQFSQWESSVQKQIYALPPNPSDPDIMKVIQSAADLFTQLFSNLPEVKNATVAASMSSYLTEKNAILADIRKTPILAIEYNFTRQLTSVSQNVGATQAGQIPDLYNVNLVLEKGFHGVNAPELTANLSATWFNSTGQARDYRASLQFDVPLKEIANIGQPVLSISGQFLSLLQEPLGQKVMLNGVTIDRRGNIGVFQTKLSIPVKGSGVKIPISFTYATRTELVKEKDVRGNIGITFDLDTLFSKAK